VTGRFLTGSRQTRIVEQHWYRQFRYQLPIIVVIVIAAFLTDRYDNYTPAQTGKQLASFYSTIKTDLQSCNDGVIVATQAWHQLTATPPKTSLGNATSLAKEAEANCTPVSDDGGVYDLEGATVPGALSKYDKLSVALYDLGQWAYPNAAQSLLDIEALEKNPQDASARANLARSTSNMRHDGSAATDTIMATAKKLNTKLQVLVLGQP
jgi:hypothetical protein